MKAFLKRWFITTVGVVIAAQIVPGIHYSVGGLIGATLLLGILNAVVRPILVVLSFPLVVISLGLFLLVINALLLYWVGHLKSFHVNTFWDAFWGALIISVVSMVLNAILKTDERVPVRRTRQSQPQPPPPRDDGKGPIIDV